MISDPAPFPAVSVVMAVHNGAPYLEAAVRSILEQSLRDIELLVVDDASTDGTPVILDRISASDPRVRVFRESRNVGPTQARNRAIAAALAPYVAIMDADDIAHPDRLAVQKVWLDRHPDVILLGSSNRQIDGEGRFIRLTDRRRDAVTASWYARFNMPLTHPTFMFRRLSEARGFLTYEQGYAEDYDLLARLLDHGDVVSLPDVLLDYRIHAASTTGTKWRLQQRDASVIALRVQQSQLPTEIVGALSAFRDAYYGFHRQPAAKIFVGLRTMLAHDELAYPRYRRWFRRQAAQLAWTAMQRSRCGNRAILAAFLGPGRDFLPALLLRLLENRRLLPRPFRSDPEV